MTHYVQTVRSRALAGRAPEYHRWYITTHIPQVLGLGGHISAELVFDTTDSNAFLCIYQLETDDLPALRVAMAATGPSMTPSEAMDVAATQIEFFERSST